MSNIKTGKIIKCEDCGKQVYMPLNRIKKGSQFCSMRCYSAYRSGEWTVCPVCKKRVYRRRKGSTKYCSRACYYVTNAVRMHKMALARRQRIPVRCTECGTTWYRTKCMAKRLRCSKKCANAFVARTYRDASTKRLIEARKHVDHWSVNARKRKREVTLKAYSDGRLKKRIGENNNFWRGGIATLQNRMRASPKYKAWRKAVYERDKYHCQHCGENRNLHAHHIKEFSTHPKLRYVVSNGLTLCQGCHSKHHGRPIPNIGTVNKKVELTQAA